MSRCRACDNEIDVKWFVPEGCKTPVLECLCPKCLLWADVAKQPGKLAEPNARRKPKYDPLPWEE